MISILAAALHSASILTEDESAPAGPGAPSRPVYKNPKRKFSDAHSYALGNATGY